MASLLRFRKLCYAESTEKCYSVGFQPSDDQTKSIGGKDETVKLPKIEDSALEKRQKKKSKREAKEWSCTDCCCWTIGYVCTAWWLLLLLHHCLPTTLPGFQVAESPGARLRREGLTALHPVVLVPGIVTGGLELREGRSCTEGLFRKRLWGGSFTEIIKRFAVPY